MSDTSHNSLSKYHHLFLKTESYPGTNDILNFIYSIWDGDSIDRLNNNVFQGINATKALYRVLGTRGIHKKNCFI